MRKDVKPIFVWAQSIGDANINNRILSKVMPSLIEAKLSFTDSTIRESETLEVDAKIYEQIKTNAELLDINSYPFDEAHNYLEIGGEAMIFHCHHYMMNLQRTILDAEYINSELFLIGSAADSLFYQFSNLCDGLTIEESKKMAEDIYKTFGNGLIDLSEMSEDGGTLTTKSSFFSKTWLIKYGKSAKLVDYYTAGFLAAAYAVIYKKPLSQVSAKQLTCMACGDSANSFEVKLGECNFALYEKKHQHALGRLRRSL